MAGVTEERDRAIRIQFEVEVARGKSPSRAIVTVAYRSGLRQDEVREIVQTMPAARRHTNQENRV